MAGDVPSHVHFDFEGDLPDFNGARSLSGGVGNLSLAGMPNRDARMADAKGNVDSQEDHGLVDMHEFRAVTARVDALETTLNTVNTNLSNLNTLFEQFMAHYASIVSGTATSGGATPVVTPPVVLSPLVGPSALSATPEAAMLKNMKPPVFNGEERDRKQGCSSYLFA